MPDSKDLLRRVRDVRGYSRGREGFIAKYSLELSGDTVRNLESGKTPIRADHVEAYIRAGIITRDSEEHRAIMAAIAEEALAADQKRVTPVGTLETLETEEDEDPLEPVAEPEKPKNPVIPEVSAPSAEKEPKKVVKQGFWAWYDGNFLMILAYLGVAVLSLVVLYLVGVMTGNCGEILIVGMPSDKVVYGCALIFQR